MLTEGLTCDAVVLGADTVRWSRRTSDQRTTQEEWSSSAVPGEGIWPVTPLWLNLEDRAGLSNPLEDESSAVQCTDTVGVSVASPSVRPGLSEMRR